MYHSQTKWTRCCQVIPVKVLPLKRWLIRHPNLLKYEREYSKILVTYFVASDEIASFKPTSKCRFCKDIPVKVLPLKGWLIRHPNLLKYEREYSKILVTYFVASDEIASFKPTSKCRFCKDIPVKVLPLKGWLIRHPNLLKYEREYSKILVTYFVASDEIASFKPTSKCRFCKDIPVKVLPLKGWLIRHPNLLKYEREYSKILVTYFVASDEIASFKPTSKCRFWRWIHVTFLDDISHHTCLALFPRRA